MLSAPLQASFAGPSEAVCCWLQVTTNSRPICSASSGQCVTSDKSTGLALNDTFTLTAANWASPNPLSYEFGIVRSGLQSAYVTNAAASTYTFPNLDAPVAPATTQTLFCCVQDTYGASACQTLNVTVTPYIPVINAAALSDLTADLAGSLAAQDPSAVLSSARRLASINVAVTGSSSTASTADANVTVSLVAHIGIYVEVKSAAGMQADCAPDFRSDPASQLPSCRVTILERWCLSSVPSATTCTVQAALTTRSDTVINALASLTASTGHTPAALSGTAALAVAASLQGMTSSPATLSSGAANTALGAVGTIATSLSAGECPAVVQLGARKCV